MRLVWSDKDGDHRPNEPRYFVGVLEGRSLGYSEGFRYEVQLLRDDGAATGAIPYTGDECPLQCTGYPVPEVVVRAAMGHRFAFGDYVSSTGEICSNDFCNPRFWPAPADVPTPAVGRAFRKRANRMTPGTDPNG